MNRKQKTMAVLSAAALLTVGASMTAFAAGWEKDDEGIWHYYDSDGDMVTDEWAKDGSNWYYLDEDGNMLTDSWVDDDYYVGSDGAMLVNQWIKTLGSDEEDDDPEDSGEHWYYFGSKGKKVTDDSKKINGKTYYFDEDGKMLYGWHEDEDGNVYYLGSEDEGWRAESQWLWLEKPGVNYDDDDDDTEDILDCTDDDDCDDEGWYWFQASGKMYNGSSKKKINGYYFLFNEHGQMLYEWINGTAVSVGSNAQLDGIATAGSASISQMLYYQTNGTDPTDGSRYTGWVEIDGSEDVGTDDETDWYYFDKGEAKHADLSASDNTGLTDDDGNQVYMMREKINGKYFAFNQNGQMQTGLQYIGGNMYYFDDDGYQQTGKLSSVEEEDGDTYYYYFQTTSNGNGKGIDGVKDNYLYFLGKRLEAEDDYRVYNLYGSYYLVNSKGKIQKSSKKYDVETVDNDTYEDATAEFSGSKLISLTASDGTEIDLAEIAEVPHIELYTNWIVAGTDGSKYTVNADDYDDAMTVDEVNALVQKAGTVTDEDDSED
jgi:glucan-binding YG repeat protein